MAPLSLSLALRCGAVHSAPLSRLSPPRPAPLQLRRARLVLGARTVRVATARRAAVCAASGEEESPAEPAEPAPAAATDNSGYESSGDENVLSGKVKSVSRMTLAELKAELSELGLDTSGAKAELVARLRVARAGATVSPAVADAAPSKRSPPSTNGTAAPRSSDSASAEGQSVEALTKMVARLEEELVLTRAMATSAVQRAEKAEAALGSASGAPPAAHTASSELATLRVVCKLHFGEVLLAVGSHPAVGSWDVAGAAPMTWSDGDVWQAVVALPAEARMEMKFVVRRPDGGLVWQQGGNLEAVLAPGALSRALCFEGSYPSAFGGAGPFTVRVAGECAVGGEEQADAAPVE